MLCPHCGQINRAGARVCERCGQALAGAASAIPFQAPSVSTGGPYPATPQAGTTPAANNTRIRPAKQMRAPEFNVQCRLCGATTSNRGACRTCGAPSGLIANPNDPTGATFLTLQMAYPPPVNAIQSVPDCPLPPTLSALRWNWGACGASLFWLMGHGIVGWSLIVLLLDTASLLAYFGPPLYLLIPYSGALLSLILGSQGNYLAWQKRRDGNAASFLQSETRWKWAGLIILPLKLLLMGWLTWVAFSHH